MADNSSLLAWCVGQLESVLGDAAPDLAEYVLSIEEDDDLVEYLGEIGIAAGARQPARPPANPLPAQRAIKLPATESF